MRLRVIDIETTGGPGSEIVEIGFVDLIAEADQRRFEGPFTQLYRPARGIPPEIVAVHHLTEEELAPYSVCTAEVLKAYIWQGETPDVFVAHNCDFERAFIGADATGNTPWICSYKVALQVWPDAPKHSNQVLRYWRGHRHDPALAMPPHRAGPDAYVTAHLLQDLLEVASPLQMIEWTSVPRRILKVPFGKHRGTAWGDVPDDYLRWMTCQADMDADTRWHASEELKRRDSGKD